VEQKGSDERKQQNDNDAEFAAQDDPQNFTEVDFSDFGLLRARCLGGFLL